MTKVYYDNWIAKLLLYGNYIAIMFFGFILCKLKGDTDKNKLPAYVVRHERIHIRQYWEVMGMSLFLMMFPAMYLTMNGVSMAIPIALLISFLLFYIIYGIEAFITFLFHVMFRFAKFKEAWEESYSFSMFEQEARIYEDNRYAVGSLPPLMSFGWLKFFGQIGSRKTKKD